MWINFFIWTCSRCFILFERFSFLTCKVYKAFMTSSPNFFINVKVIKNVRRSSCFIIINDFFINLLNNLMKYVSLLNCDILNMIWKSYVNLVYLVFQRPLMIHHLIFLCFYIPIQSLYLFGLKINNEEKY